MMSLIIFLVSGLVHHIAMSSAGTVAPSANASQNLFAGDLFGQLAANALSSNVVYSPVSIHGCLTLAFFGAGGATADELRRVLKLGAAIERNEIAANYGEFLKKFINTNKETSTGGPRLHMANRLYVNDGLKLHKEFNEIASKYLHSTAERVHFADAAAAVNTINGWVEKETQQKITNLLQPNTVDDRTSAVLVNAIYFKALWRMPFSKSSTHRSDFNVDAKKKVPVDMMFLNEDFLYGDLGDLQASAIEMPYKDTDLSMLILLPHKIDGLADLERKLTKVDFNDITARMSMEDVEVFLPKFRIEYDINLKEPLRKMGIQRIFSDDADLSKLFQDEPPQKVSQVVHKAYLDVNEAGSEAAAATFMKIVPMCLKLDQKRFKADHPFVFAIRDKTAVYFAGHVVNF